MESTNFLKYPSASYSNWEKKKKHQLRSTKKKSFCKKKKKKKVINLKKIIINCTNDGNSMKFMDLLDRLFINNLRLFIISVCQKNTLKIFNPLTPRKTLVSLFTKISILF